MSKADHVMEKLASKKKKGLSNSQKDFIAGTLAGAGATAAFYPLDTYITAQQAGSGKLNKDLKNAKTIAAKAKRLYKGLPVKILKNAPTSGVTLMLYGAVMRALGGKNQKNKDK